MLTALALGRTDERNDLIKDYPMTTLLLSIPEVSKLIGIGRTKVYELIDEGSLDAVRIGARRLITAASVQAFVASLMQGEARQQ